MPDVDDAGIARFYAAVGSDVRSARLRAGLSQAELAERVGLTRSSVANLETGRQRVALHLFMLIAEALDVKARDLIPERLVSDLNKDMPNLSEQLADSPGTSQDFVREAVARLSHNPISGEK